MSSCRQRQPTPAPISASSDRRVREEGEEAREAVQRAAEGRADERRDRILGLLLRDPGGQLLLRHYVRGCSG